MLILYGMYVWGLSVCKSVMAMPSDAPFLAILVCLWDAACVQLVMMTWRDGSE